MNGLAAQSDTLIFTLNATAIASGAFSLTADAGEALGSEIIVFGVDTDQRAATTFASLPLTIAALANNAPVVTPTSTALSYLENATTAIDPALTVTDADSTNLVSATVSITTGFTVGQDILSFVNQNGITGSYNTSTGVLSLTGSATVANYQAALRSITYTNSSDNPNTTPRTIGFTVNDGLATSILGTRNVTITAANDAPVITPTATALAYLENATTAVDATLTVTDVDSANLISATVSITTGFNATQDILSFVNQNGITGTYNSTTGVLSLTGSATVANYQTALRSITYTNNSDTPNITPRTINFQVNDGSLNSVVGSRIVNITAVSDAPVIVNKSFAVNEGNSIIVTNSFGNVSHLLEGIVTWVRISRKKRWYLKQSNVQPAEV